jgi:hypothetical protein
VAKSKTASLAMIASLIASPVMGQWLHHPTPGIPRTADGKPDLTAPAPRTQDGKTDLSGIWHRTSDRYYNNIAADLKPGDVLPWAEALYQRRKADFGKDSMEVRCLPFGPAASTTPYADIKIIQTPALIAILMSDLTYRQIHLDGRQLPKDPNPTWMGYSVGHWEGGTLVVESAGFTDRSWLDYDGHPHTEGLRMVERFRRRDFGHLDLDIMFEDPGAYAKPWTVAAPLELFPDTELLEAVCNENEKDVSHMPGKPAGQQTAEIKVTREILAKYAGAYEIQEKGTIRPAVVSVSGDALFLDLDRAGPQQLVAISETNFSQSGNVIQFVADSDGVIAHFLIHTVEGEERAIRKR